ncbi:glycosyltransferase family 4 protein [Roseicyclus amphidinii]|uniref:glycosyltransferase family 4 protein n=1 Tax=Roseicyclus amphidinii TaxID=3034232 RepID=UPI0024E196CA|nr:glycosyltransferase family 4 protein [Roseicyclus sp. Amp-Y-6]
MLHIANWYPGPWDNVEGNFVRDQIALFREELPGDVVVVQVRPARGQWPRFERPVLDGGARGYILHAPVRPGSKPLEWLSTLLLVLVLLRERAWRFRALHFHIAYPLLIHSRFWRKLFRRPLVISEHWSAYHYKFHLPRGSRALKHMQRPFQQGDPVLAVSNALLQDIREFSERDDFSGFVLPNVVPLHGAAQSTREVPTLFAVNRWVAVKNPMPMLEGMHRAAESGIAFNLVVGGYGELIEDMKAFVAESALRDRTCFTGKMTKPEIATQLAASDGYLYSSDYETFSIACAEALGAGVPLIGPHIPAIAEYAGPQDRVEVAARTPEAWAKAIEEFIAMWIDGNWDRRVIAHRAQARFSPSGLRDSYRTTMEEIGVIGSHTLINDRPE